MAIARRSRYASRLSTWRLMPIAVLIRVQGAATALVAAVAPELAHTGGHHLDDCREAYTVANDADLAQHPHGVKEWALDPTTAERLWNVSVDLLRS